ncbi:hypothetical protein KSP40_PGU007262 [Platanthera guangdongensis]|uniref:AT-hook motif nuclear-localized protein n=1 Tax=Platanthera guangdongensis TaxID=2320717 RepID=A0ABR2LUL4_9ASPA
MQVRSEQPFTMNMQKNHPAATHSSIAGMRLMFSPEGSAIYKPTTTTPANSNSAAPTPLFHGGSTIPTSLVDSGSAAGDRGSAALPGMTVPSLSAVGEQLKKKRGRPRKYSTDGPMPLALTTISPTAAGSPGGGCFSSPSAGQPNQGISFSSDPLKKGRGRPRGSTGKKQKMLALGSAGTAFTPHVITVNAGEDVSLKIMSFSHHGPRAICVLSANGAISNVTLRQAATSGGTVTYEGRFEILSLSGSFLLSENDGHRSRTGGLSVSLAGPDGRVVGGGVAGLLTAASPVQVVMGSFISEGKKEAKQINFVNHLSPTAKLVSGDGGGNSPSSRGTASESSGGPTSPLNQNTGMYMNNQLGMSNISWK